MEGVLGVRKGAWTEEEDVLLKQCIETFGEGNWHQIPLRAGLNRCRKSCRLRWLNYLKPNIKRGEFEEDEVDLLMKLHKLLGNRWSMIAGRLPGRTANDVKNYWNNQIRKKEVVSRERQTSKFSRSLYRNEVMKPQPRTFSKSFVLKCKSRLLELTQKKDLPNVLSLSPSPSPSPGLASDPWSPEKEKEKEWWETVLEEVVEGGGEGNTLNYMVPVDDSDVEQSLKTTGEVGDGLNRCRKELQTEIAEFEEDEVDLLTNLHKSFQM